MPPRRLNVALTAFRLPRSTVIAPLARTEGTLKAKALGGPMCGFPMRLKRMRSIALASVAVPTVDRDRPPAAAGYVLLISRCDSAPMVSNTSELFSEPETPVKPSGGVLGIRR